MENQLIQLPQMNSRPGKVGDNMLLNILVETDVLVKQQPFSILASKKSNCQSMISPIKKNGSGNLIDQISNKTVHLDGDRPAKWTRPTTMHPF